MRAPLLLALLIGCVLGCGDPYPSKQDKKPPILKKNDGYGQSDNPVINLALSNPEVLYKMTRQERRRRSDYVTPYIYSRGQYLFLPDCFPEGDNTERFRQATKEATDRQKALNSVIVQNRVLAIQFLPAPWVTPETVRPVGVHPYEENLVEREQCQYEERVRQRNAEFRSQGLPLPLGPGSITNPTGEPEY